MNHRASPAFWSCYRRLPVDVQRQADRAFALLRRDPRHPSLHFKKVGGLWSARIGRQYRALAEETADGLLWIWIGSHAGYDRKIP